MPKNGFPVRNLRFASDASIPRHWLGGRRAVTSLLNNLSVFFPAGERWFVEAVRAHLSAVDDPAVSSVRSLRACGPELLRDARAFCGQEGAHSREHVRYNAVVRAHGYPVDWMERRIERLLAFFTRVLPPRSKLAATCALEHFTALLAHFLLEDDRILADGHPVMAAMWRWHAAEENEHKAVAFDVFRAAGGTYFERVWTMIVATGIFWSLVAMQQVKLMRVDGMLASAREWRDLARFAFGEVKVGRLGWLYLQYYRPGFHPNDIDASELLERWKRELATSPVYQAAG
jgi:predicted metal-dependent hydrolase